MDTAQAHTQKKIYSTYLLFVRFFQSLQCILCFFLLYPLYGFAVSTRNFIMKCDSIFFPFIISIFQINLFGLKSFSLLFQLMPSPTDFFFTDNIHNTMCVYVCVRLYIRMYTKHIFVHFKDDAFHVDISKIWFDSFEVNFITVLCLSPSVYDYL